MPEDTGITVVMPSSDKQKKKFRTRVIELQEEWDPKKGEWKVIYQKDRTSEVTEKGKEDYSIY